MRIGFGQKITLSVLSVALLIFLGGPFLWLLSTSVKSPLEIIYQSGLIPEQIYFQNYIEALEKSGLIQAALNSLTVALMATFITSLLSLVPAYFFARSHGAGSKLMATWILLSQVFPLSLLIIPLFLLMQRVNLLNSLIGLILVYVVLNLPFSLWIIRSFILSIPIDLEEQASVDGANGWKLVWLIIFPLAVPGVSVAALFTFINVWNEFFFALVLISDPEQATLPLKLAQFLGAEGQGRFGALAAATVLAIVPSLLMFAGIQKRFSDNAVAGAIKG
ncbi:MAG: hypothetical protein RLY84_402 [Actinomycetota bacterium]|jgi:multiple sugar transport system permease protein